MVKTELTELDSPFQFNIKEFKQVNEFDSLIRCQICKDIYKVPNSFKKCGHTFCSNCIRESLAAMLNLKNRAILCPICSNQVDSSQLIFNQSLDQIALNWIETRKSLLQLQSNWQEQQTLLASSIPSTSRLPPSTASNTSNSTNVNSSLDAPAGSTRASRSKSSACQSTLSGTGSGENGFKEKGKGKGKAKEEEADIIVDSSDSEEEVEVIDMDMNDPEMIVTCFIPGCRKKLKNRQMNFHMDKDHDMNNNAKASSDWSNLMKKSGSASEGGGSNGKNTSKSIGGASSSSSFSSSAMETKPKVMKSEKAEDIRLQGESYSLMKTTELTKRLKELDLPIRVAEGLPKKPTLERRHRQWTAIWNANCDLLSSDPRKKSKSKLKAELEKWETLQDAKPVGIGNTQNYERDNKSAFKELTALARLSNEKIKAFHAKKIIDEEKASDEVDEEVAKPGEEIVEKVDVIMEEGQTVESPLVPTTNAITSSSSSVDPLVIQNRNPTTSSPTPNPSTMSLHSHSDPEVVVVAGAEGGDVVEGEGEEASKEVSTNPSKPSALLADPLSSSPSAIHPTKLDAVVAASSPPPPPPLINPHTVRFAPTLNTVSPSPSSSALSPSSARISALLVPDIAAVNSTGTSSGRKRTRSELEGTTGMLVSLPRDSDEEDENREEEARGGKRRVIGGVLEKEGEEEEGEGEEGEEEKENEESSGTEMELPRPSQRVKADEEVTDWSLFDLDSGSESESDSEQVKEKETDLMG